MLVYYSDQIKVKSLYTTHFGIYYAILNDTVVC